MSRFPRGKKILDAYEDQVEALERLLHARATAMVDPKSRFYKLSDADVQERLEQDRHELDLSTLLMLMASFEATIQADAKDRVRKRARDPLKKPLRDLIGNYGIRLRLESILSILEARAGMAAAIKQKVRTLVKHRHWLAHGGHWANKHGKIPEPVTAHTDIVDYVKSLQTAISDFPCE